MLEAYLEKTSESREADSSLFISLNRPFKAVKTVTVRNIFLDCMDKSGIDISIFKPHSARSSVTAVPGLTLS